jgi:sec-independent protein translocase protein TatA
MGFGELVLILILVLLFFGASRLPALGAGLGKAVKGFKAATGEGESPGKDGADGEDGGGRGRGG